MAQSPQPLSNSTRSLKKVTHVPIRAPENNRDRGKALLKSGFVRQLGLQSGEIDSIKNSRETTGASPRTHMGQHHDESTKGKHSQAELWNILKRFEGSPLASALPPASIFADIASSQLIEFGNDLVKVRQNLLNKVQDPQGQPTEMHLRVKIEAFAEDPFAIALANSLLNQALLATNAFTANTAISPIGMLNLERLEMSPAGIEKGELIATIPLAPKEKTNVVEQEWSVISQEFSTIVTDSLENFSKTGVTENSELAQATASQNAHSNQFNVTASASGGCGFVSGSVSTNFGSQGSDSTSATDSRKHAVTTTQEASSRVTQSRKVTISTTALSGSSLTTTRSLENTSETSPMRIDYFSMMRKWRVGLYRYGLRMTYDITVPEPGAAMRSDFQELEKLQEELQSSFQFPDSYDSITEANYKEKCVAYGAQIPAPPLPEWYSMSVSGSIEKHGTDGSGDIFTNQTPVHIPEGYQIDSIVLTLELSFQGPNNTHNRRFDVLGCRDDTWIRGPDVQKVFPNLTGLNGLPFLQGRTGEQAITHISGGFRDGGFQFDISLKRTEEDREAWKASVYNALYDAAQSTYYNTQSNKQLKFKSLQDRINGVDTLTLRREENDEIMKCVLRWILGTNFEFVPDSVINLFKQTAGTDTNNLNYGINFTGNSIDPKKNILDWSILYRYEAMVNFINQAIEWENVVFFLYSYFWDIPQSWKFIRNIQHPDATRQAFLRAGAARVVLTVRKGYEEAFTWFAEQGDITMPPKIPPGHPYMTIAQQIQNYDSTNYPGIPPANPGKAPPSNDTPQAASTSAAQLDSSSQPVEIKVVETTGFTVGAKAIIDNWDAGITDGNPKGVQESQTITAVNADTKTITVARLKNSHGGDGESYPIYQTSAKGLLIAEWYEYTPSRGTTIVVNSDIETML